MIRLFINRKETKTMNRRNMIKNCQKPEGGWRSAKHKYIGIALNYGADLVRINNMLKENGV